MQLLVGMEADMIQRVFLPSLRFHSEPYIQIFYFYAMRSSSFKPFNKIDDDDDDFI